MTINEVRPLADDAELLQASDQIYDTMCFGVYTNDRLRAVSYDRSEAVAEAILAAILTEDAESSE